MSNQQQASWPQQLRFVPQQPAFVPQQQQAFVPQQQQQAFVPQQQQAYVPQQQQAFLPQQQQTFVPQQQQAFVPQQQQAFLPQQQQTFMPQQQQAFVPQQQQAFFPQQANEKKRRRQNIPLRPDELDAFIGASPLAHDDDEFDVLSRICDSLYVLDRTHDNTDLRAFQADGADGNPALDAVLALAALAEDHAVEGFSTPDTAMTLAQLLACPCALCAQRPSVAMAAFDIDMQWFDLSLDLCSDCFSQRAVRLHKQAEQRKSQSVTDRRSRTVDKTCTELRSLAVERVLRLIQRGAVRPLQIDTRCLFENANPRWSVWSTAYSPDGATIAAGTISDEVWLLDAKTGKCQHRLNVGDSYASMVKAVSFSPDGATIATLCDLSGQTGRGRFNAVRLWNPVNGAVRHELQGHHDEPVNSVVYSPDGTTIATSGEDSPVRLWDAASGACRHLLQCEKNYPMAVAFAPDSATIAVAHIRESNEDPFPVRLWDVMSGECRRELHGTATGLVTSLTYSPDGSTIAATGGKTVRLLDTVSDKGHRTLQGHRSPARSSAAFSPDGATLVTGSYNGTLQFWDVRSLQCLRIHRRLCKELGDACLVSLAFAPDGASIAVSTVYSIVVLDAAILFPGRGNAHETQDCVIAIANRTEANTAISSVGCDADVAQHRSQIKRHRDERPQVPRKDGAGDGSGGGGSDEQPRQPTVPPRQA